ncbi:protein piccolo isoform X1 [Tachysurus ichikawai]
MSRLCMWPPPYNHPAYPHYMPLILPVATAGPQCTSSSYSESPSRCPFPNFPRTFPRPFSSNVLGFLRDLNPQPYLAQTGCLSLRQQRHSVAGVLTLQTALSNTPGNEITDVRHLTLRKAMSEERPQRDRVSRSHRSTDAPVTAASLDSGLSGSAFSLLEEEGETNGVDSAIFQVPRFGKIPNGTDVVMSIHGETEGKTQVMGEIKIALKKEMKTEGEHLVLEILQCRNITYKFKTPDHLPDMYVKLYVVNVATQKRIIKKKTRVCRHDREPSFNETFRFCMNPTGHSIQVKFHI